MAGRLFVLLPQWSCWFLNLHSGVVAFAVFEILEDLALKCDSCKLEITLTKVEWMLPSL